MKPTKKLNTKNISKLAFILIVLLIGSLVSDAVMILSTILILAITVCLFIGVGIETGIEEYKRVLAE